MAATRRNKSKISTTKKPPKRSVDKDGSADYIGRRISRLFDDELYHGTVDSFDASSSLWHVTYDDNDAEELDYVELLVAMDLFREVGEAGRGGRNENGNDSSFPSRYIGRRVSKRFGRKMYHGTVDGADEDHRLWHVTYDDGDAEELDHEELLIAMDWYQRINNAHDDENDGSVQMRISRAKGDHGRDASSETIPSEQTKSTTYSIPSKRNYPRLVVPIAVAVIAVLLWLGKEMLFANAAASSSSSSFADKQERLLRSTTLLKFQPDKYQGQHKRKRYFEGWYYKFVTPLNGLSTANTTTPTTDGGISSSMSMAVVPGIFYGNTTDSTESHAFIFVTLSGKQQHYYKFPIHEFSYASGREEYYISVGPTIFTHSGVSLDIVPKEGDDATLTLRGNLSFHNPHPWPISPLGLGAMGPVGWLPGLECTHGIVSFDHVLRGSLLLETTTRTNEDGCKEEMQEEEEEEDDATTPTTCSASSSVVSSVISFDNGRGYTEKDHGRSFPSLWVWIQSNSFRNHPGTSLFVSIARMPYLGMELPGFTAALWHEEQLIPFATWSGAKFEEVRISEEEVYIVMRSGRVRHQRYRIEITVDRRNVPEVLLYAPVNFTTMAPFVWEALQARVHMRLLDARNGDVLVDDVGEYAGLEVHGNVQWLVDNVCGKETASKIVCL